MNKGRLFLSAAFILAGSSVVAARFLTENLLPFTMTFASLLIASLTAFLLGGKQICAAIRKLSARYWAILLLQAFFGIFLFRVFLTFGLLYTSAAEAGVVTGTSPAITAILTRVMLKERLNKNKITGILFTLAGIFLLQGFSSDAAPFNAGHLLGNALILGAAGCQSLFSTLARKANMGAREEYRLPPFAQAGIVSFAALLMCLPPMLLERDFFSLTSLPAAAWGALFWYGSVVTVAAFAFMFMGAKYCDGYTIAAFTGLIPVSALFFSITILGEAVRANHLLGCAMVVIAIIFISRGENGRAKS